MQLHYVPARYRALTVCALSAGLLLLIFLSEQIYTHAQVLAEGEVVAAGTISGSVFQDFNGNGTFDTATTIANTGFGNVGVAIDRGVANVEVRAYSALNSNVTSGGVVLTAANGSYSVTTTDGG